MKRLGKTQEHIVSSLRAGSELYRFFKEGAVEYFIEGRGQVSTDSVERLLARGFIEERQDALFGVTNTYQLKE